MNSLSSWSRMWQCSTYPGGLVGSNENRFVPGLEPLVAPPCGAHRIASRVISPGHILIVSFQPPSIASGARDGHAPLAQAPCEVYLAALKLMLPPSAPAELRVV